MIPDEALLSEREQTIAEKEAQLAERDCLIVVRDAELYSKTLHIEHLKAQLAVLRRARFGRSPEKLDREIEQLELLLGELEEGVAESKSRAAQAEKQHPASSFHAGRIAITHEEWSSLRGWSTRPLRLPCRQEIISQSRGASIAGIGRRHSIEPPPSRYTAARPPMPSTAALQ